MQGITSTPARSTAILLSPLAGAIGGESTLYAELAEVCAGRGELYAPTTEAELAQACAELHAQGCARVVVVGGDGTWRRVLSELYRQYGAQVLPTLALVPAGTVNLAARQWKLRGKRSALLARALSAQFTEVVERDCLKVTMDGREHLAFTVGTGLVSRFFEIYEQQPKRGKGVAVAIVLRTFFGSFLGSAFARRVLSPVRGALTVEGQPKGTLDLTLLVSSVFSELGLGLKPTYRAGTSADQLHLVATTLPVRQLGPKALRVWRGLPLLEHPSSPAVIDCLTRGFALEFASPHPIVLDGDAVMATRVAVVPGPKLRVLSL